MPSQPAGQLSALGSDGVWRKKQRRQQTSQRPHPSPAHQKLQQQISALNAGLTDDVLLSTSSWKGVYSSETRGTFNNTVFFVFIIPYSSQLVTPVRRRGRRQRATASHPVAPSLPLIRALGLKKVNIKGNSLHRLRPQTLFISISSVLHQTQIITTPRRR